MQCLVAGLQVAAAHSERTQDAATGQGGMRWDFPYVLGRMRGGKDKQGHQCRVYDATVHPATVQAAAAHQGVKVGGQQLGTAATQLVIKEQLTYTCVYCCKFGGARGMAGAEEWDRMLPKYSAAALLQDQLVDAILDGIEAQEGCRLSRR